MDYLIIVIHRENGDQLCYSLDEKIKLIDPFRPNELLLVTILNPSIIIQVSLVFTIIQITSYILKKLLVIMTL